MEHLIEEHLLPKPSQVKVVVVSDIHIMQEDDERGQIFQDLLSDLAKSYQLEYLVLLGDIFDFYFGRGPYFARKFAAIKNKVEEIAKKGTRVIYVQGNHEFALTYAKWQGVEITAAKTSVLELKNGKKLALIHGDKLDESLSYRVYQKIVNSQPFSLFVSLLPSFIIDKLCLWVSSLSRHRNTYRKLPHRKILGRASLWQQSTNCKWAVMGHFHVPYNFLGPKKSSQLICLDSWDKPNALFLADEFYRVYFKGKDKIAQKLYTV